MVMLIERIQRRSEEMLRDRDGIGWAVGLERLRYVFWVDASVV